MHRVVIVGGSFSGLTCARILADSGYQVMILEKNSFVGTKTCACGVTKQDTSFIDEKLFNYPLEPVYLIGKRGKRVRMPEGRGLISSIVRSKVIQSWCKEISSLPNVEIKLNTLVAKIESDAVITQKGERYSFEFLVGADGSFSTVRKYLNLPTNKYMVAVQYIANKLYTDFEIYADERLFDKGYAWIFPNKGFTSIGCCVDSSSPNRLKLKTNLDNWIEKQGIDISGAKSEGFIINYDYQGYKFDNMFLAGDAAGLSNGLTGKGIYGACISGERIAHEITKSKGNDRLELWLKEKKEDEAILKHKGNFVDLKIKSFTKEKGSWLVQRLTKVLKGGKESS